MDKWGENNENWISDHFPIQTEVRFSYKTNVPDSTVDGFDGDVDIFN